MTRTPWVLALLLCSAACQPSVRCDSGQREFHGGCYPVTAPPADAGDEADGGAPPQDAGGSECPGDRTEDFGKACSTSSDCGCGAPDCALSPLNFCTKLNCDPDDASSCPEGWTCFMIPAGMSPDPNLTHLCLQL